MKLKFSKGFTLVEILVVMTIIGVLVTVVFSAINPLAQVRKGRDAQRRNDIKQYQTALENYSLGNNLLYPSWNDTAGVRASTVLCDINFQKYIDSCLEDPKYARFGGDFYRYQSDGSGGGEATATKWVLWARFEYFTSRWTNWVVCSNRKVGEKAASGFSVTGGNCPL